MSAIRPATPADSEAILRIAKAIGLFSDEELAGLRGMLEGHFSEEQPAGQWLVAADAMVYGVAFYAPEPFTHGAWNLYFLAVDPARQRHGTGAALVAAVEATLRAKQQRLLLVETSALPALAQARAFYPRQGFVEEARIRDYYKAEDDKIIFRKLL